MIRNTFLGLGLTVGFPETSGHFVCLTDWQTAIVNIQPAIPLRFLEIASHTATSDDEASCEGDPKILQSLNSCLKDQLTAINQLFPARTYGPELGPGRIQRLWYGRSIKAMKMADSLIERVLFLDGLPNLQDLGKLIGEERPEMLGGDLQMLTDMRARFGTRSGNAEEARDFVSRRTQPRDPTGDRGAHRLGRVPAMADHECRPRGTRSPADGD